MSKAERAPSLAESDRIKRLRAVEDELRLVADTDLPYAKHARRMLDALEAADE